MCDLRAGVSADDANTGAEGFTAENAENAEDTSEQSERPERSEGAGSAEQEVPRASVRPRLALRSLLKRRDLGYSKPIAVVPVESRLMVLEKLFRIMCSNSISLDGALLASSPDFTTHGGLLYDLDYPILTMRADSIARMLTNLVKAIRS